MHFVFRKITLGGDGQRVFVMRRVCKRCKAHVDEMDNRHWAVLHACSIDDRALAAFLAARVGDMYEDAPVHGNMKDEFVTVMTSGRSHRLAMNLLLDLCKQAAVEAACAPTRFAKAFDNELRGMVYYAVWKGTRATGLQRDEEEQLLVQWWRATLVEVREKVEQRIVHRTAIDKQAARESLANFVDKMSDISFHPCTCCSSLRADGHKVFSG